MEEIIGTDNNSIPAKMVSVMYVLGSSASLPDEFVGVSNTCGCHNEYDNIIAPLPSIEYRSGIFDLYMLNIYYRDAAGQERFRSLIPSYIRDSSVAVVVYVVASRQSFVNTSKWIEEVRTERGSKSQIEEAEAKARDLNVIFIETSAKAGFNIKALFRKIAAALPGMETFSSTTQEDMVDVNLKFTNANASQSQQQSGGCAC
ncbi:hypothetical protein Goklo_019798 [Gossypium klotzschianum]|uniref:Uncharacterized protein n=1 Tax=Gossypium klotzschianum TaxID=34286 RepID=A0A7J8UQ26_9ROSI|nr:hypothetical protein [Gossypium klotzschianum]